MKIKDVDSYTKQKKSLLRALQKSKQLESERIFQGNEGLPREEEPSNCLAEGFCRTIADAAQGRGNYLLD